MSVPGGGRLLPGSGASGVGRSPNLNHSSFLACGRGPRPTGCGCGGCGRGDPSLTPQRALLQAGFACCQGGMRAPGGGVSCLGVGRPGRALSHPRLLVLSGVRPGPASHWPWVWCAGVGARLSLAPCPVPRFVVCCAHFSGLLLLLGTCPRAVVVAGGVPLSRASCPHFGAPLLVWSGRSRCSGWLSRGRGAFPYPGGCRPRLYWVAARSTWRPAENRALCACRWPLLRQGRWARSASYPFGAPRWGCLWRVPPALVLGSVRCGGSACVDLVTDVSGLPYRPSFDGGLGRCTGAVLCGRRHRPFRVGGCHARVPRVCACACPAWPGRESWPPGHIQVRSTFHLAGLGALYACGAPSRLGLPRLWLLLSFSFPFPSLVAPPLSPASRVFRPGMPWALASFCPPPLFFSAPPLRLAFRVFRPRLPSASAPCRPPTRPPPFFFPLFVDFSFFLFPFFFCRLSGAGRFCVSLAAGCAPMCLGGAVPVVALFVLAGVVW